MRVLFATIGSRADLQPVIGTSSHWKAFGHEGGVCLPPDCREWLRTHAYLTAGARRVVSSCGIPYVFAD